SFVGRVLLRTNTVCKRSQYGSSIPQALGSHLGYPRRWENYQRRPSCQTPRADGLAPNHRYWAPARDGHVRLDRPGTGADRLPANGCTVFLGCGNAVIPGHYQRQGPQLPGLLLRIHRTHGRGHLDAFDGGGLGWHHPDRAGPGDCRVHCPQAGTRWIHAVMPPVVMGTILALIGLNLAGATTEGMVEVPLTTFGTTMAVIITAVLFRGFLGRLSILLGIVLGYLLALAQQQIDFQPVAEASWIGLPAFHAPAFQFVVLFLFLPVVFVLVAENIGHVRTVGLMTRSNLDRHNGRALIADGLATMVSGFGGGVGTTTYAENSGVMASSRIFSTAAYWVAGLVAISLAFFPKFCALIATIPMGVAAGAGIILNGMIGIMGARTWVNNAVDFSNTI